MAFRAPKPHAPQRVYTSTAPPRDERFAEAFAEAPPASNARLEDSQEWILFSPAQPSVPDTLLSHTTSTDKTRDTVGRSRLSDYGSLGTEVRSWEAGTEDVHESTIHEDDDEELDSLDSHLLEFRSHDSHHDEQCVQHGLLSQHLVTQEEAVSHSVFPNHDGLGSFQLGRRPASNPASPAHEHSQFQFPSQPHIQGHRRTKRRRESIDLILLHEATAREAEEEKEREKRIRIEEWRMEQSRAIMEEVQKESRRQRQRLAGKRTNTLREYHEGEMASMGGVFGTAWDDVAAGQPVMSEHVETGESGVKQEGEGEEGFWQRITRRLVQDLMGIDDKLLGILFGESLPDDLETQLNNAEGGNALDGHAADSGWENRLLERIARELGLLVNQISDHPGAFSTYLRVQQEPLPYAGLPIIPEAQPEVKEEQPIISPVETTATQQSNIFFPTIPTAQSKPEPIVYDPISSSRHYFDSEMDYFPPPAPPVAPQPTTNLSTSHASSAYQLPSHSIHTVASSLIDPSPTPRAAASNTGFTKEDWEKQLDIGLVFKYLRSRFSSRKTANHAPFVRTHSSPADQAARAARVRQHHPLVSNRPVAERRSSYKVVVPQAAAAGLQRRRSSSCASQSTKVSGQRSRRLSGSSRCYWDIGCGGSLGSGSLVVSTGGVGGWGDV